MKFIILLNIFGLGAIGIVSMLTSQFSSPGIQASLDNLLKQQADMQVQIAQMAMIQQQKLKTAEASTGCPPIVFVRPFRKRADLGAELKRLGLKGVGVEVGTQAGIYSKELLQGWQQADTYVQVDLWAPQKNYRDAANVDMLSHESWMGTASELANEAMRSGWVKHTRQCRNYSMVCVHEFKDNSLDFVYIDARHDRQGALEDITAYWPKVRSGGVMAGHDYLEQSDLEQSGSQDDWTLNGDGTHDVTRRVVKGAVDDFFSGVADTSPPELRKCPRQVAVGYMEGTFSSWAVGK